MNGTSSITVKDLAVVDFYNDFRAAVADHDKWRQRKLTTHVAFAEKCSRNIWYGANESFADFPPLIPDESSKRLTGPEAYAHLLRFMLGQVNPTGYDSAAAERFFNGWSKLNRMNPQKALAFQELIWQLSADYVLLKNHVVGQTKPDRPWLVARDLSGLKKHESVLIVGGQEGSDGRASVFTHKIAVTMNGNGLYKLRDIGITHPDRDVAHALCREIMKIYKEKGISGNISVYDFYEHTAMAMEWSDRVFVTLEMDTNPVADQFMIDCWQNRQRRDNTLTHMKSPYVTRDVSSPLWAEARLDNFISPERIRKQIDSNQEDYKHMLVRTHEAAVYCGQLRAQKIQPTTALLRETPQLLAPPEQQLNLL